MMVEFNVYKLYAITTKPAIHFCWDRFTFVSRITFFFVLSLRAEILKYNYRPSTTWQNNMFSANNLHQKSLIAPYTMSHGEKHNFNVGESAFSVSR